MFADYLGAIDGSGTTTTCSVADPDWVNPYCVACDSEHTAIMSIKGNSEWWVCKDCKYTFTMPCSYKPLVRPLTMCKSTVAKPERELVEIGQQNDPLGTRKPPVLGKRKAT